MGEQGGRQEDTHCKLTLRVTVVAEGKIQFKDWRLSQKTTEKREGSFNP